jgi:hypothetical protein
MLVEEREQALRQPVEIARKRAAGEPTWPPRSQRGAW